MKPTNKQLIKTMRALCTFLVVVGLMTAFASNALAAKTQYASDSRKMNFRFSPLGLLFGYLNADLDFKVGQEWTLGPSLGYLSWNLDSLGTNYNVTAYQIGARANWYFDGTAINDGWYFGPSINFVSVKVDSNDYSASTTGIGLTGIVGYNWMWESFNIMLGGGLSGATTPGEVEVTRKSTNTKEKVSVGRSSAGLALEFTLGWAF